MPRTFRLRGIVEGFYGKPWSHEARLDVISFVAERAMNAYVYAPKDDAKHRALWREQYDDDELARFRALIDHAHGVGVRFGFAISPGLDIDYSSEKDRAVLLEKLQPFAAAGLTWFFLLLDDIPSAPGLAARQADIAGWLLDAVRRESEGADLTVCPTEYIGTRPSPYLSVLGEQLPPDVDLMWTGPTVCSPTIGADEARDWCSTVGGRQPLVWDNYPVNDGAMEPSLHLGPYRGRDPALADTTIGVLCNPMRHAYASQVALATAADFLLDPDGYEPDASWQRAIDAVGGARRAPLRVLADACADSALCEPSELDLARRVARTRRDIGGPAWVEPVRETVEVLRAARRLPDEFPSDADDELTREVAPWAAAAGLEARTALAALRLLQQVRPVATFDGDAGRAVGVDAETAMHTAFLVMFSWSGARRAMNVVFGPRFALYPAVVQLRDGNPGVDVRAAVREDSSAVDALCRFALAEYEAWSADPTTDLTVFVDDEPRAVDADGSFDARGNTVLVRDGRNSTRLRAGEPLPLRDPRIS